ncbi:hypothetical protein GCM10009776_09940 [Microbacterium deminutum]|uniref:DUF3099 domain-containing protein n=2 Tax=Microbacterium deminutum TaxID=344164 RepID=A0ABN2QE40_9MICO
MGIRILCFVLMVVVTPYGWYTWVFGIGAVLLPYIAVVMANVSQNVRPPDAERPELAIPATPHDAPKPDSGILRVEETRVVTAADEPDERE